MKLTEEGLALIRRFEGYRAKAYRCPAGVWTIGYGHTSQAGEPVVTSGLEMSRARAAEVLAADAVKFADGVRKSLRREVSDAQFSALVSFAYNVGIGNFMKSSVLKSVNAGDFAAVPRRLQLWIRGGGKVLPGLVRRRAAEAELFLAAPGQAEPADLGTAERIEGKPAARSTTVLSALAAILTAAVSGVLNGGAVAMLAAAIIIVAALWIIRERLRKAKEDGL